LKGIRYAGGILTEKPINSLRYRFQTSFSKILPLPEVVDLDHPVPSGILYRNAFLYFISRFSAPNNLFNSAQIEALAELLEYNMTLISSEEANEDMIRSLLIISLSSARQDERFFKVEDQFGAGAKAYMLATSMGLDDKVEKLGNEPRESLSAEWNRPLLSSVCLVSRGSSVLAQGVRLTFGAFRFLAVVQRITSTSVESVIYQCDFQDKR
jgi:hypothetical protein